MKLEIIGPTKQFTIENVVKVRAESISGWFTVLPKHIDFTTLLLPGIVELSRDSGESLYTGIDEGLFVKEGSHLKIAAEKAIVTESFDEIAGTVEKQFKEQDERDRKLRSMLLTLENDLARKLMNGNSI